MKLSICVPHYNEPTELVRTLLDSIKLQQNVDFKEIEVIIVNDGANYEYVTKVKKSAYPFKIRTYKNKHAGVSATRDKAFDYAIGDYVMFCDVDDMFYSVSGICTIFKAIDRQQFDVMVSTFIEEGRSIAKQIRYFPHENDSVFVHGKVYRRQFLLDNEIRWNHDLTIHEDSYFNYLSIALAEDAKTLIMCKAPFYLWRWRDASVCRHDPKYILKTYNNLFESNTALVHELIRRVKLARAASLVNKMVYEAYFTMNKKEWLDQENQQYRHDTEVRFKQYYEEFQDMYKFISDKDRNHLILGIKNRMYKEGLFLETITFDEWMSHILAL